MYPSKADPSHGTFVRNIYHQLQSDPELDVTLSSFTRKAGSNFSKFYQYLRLYLITCIEIMRGFDVVYTHFVSHTILPILLLHKITRFKLVVHVHGTDVYLKKPLTMGAWIKYLLSIAAFKISNLVVVPSRAFGRYVAQNYPVHPESFFVFPSGGVDRRVFFRGKKGYVHECKRVGYCGRIEKSKGCDLIIGAADLLRRQGVALEFSLIGNGPLYESLETNIEKKGLTNVQICHAIPQSELVDFYNSLDLFVYPTERESLGLVALEAMSCGVPVLATAIPATEEYIEENYNGFLLSLRSEEAIASAILRIMKLSSKSLIDISKQAITSSARYSSEQVQQTLVDSIKKIH